MVYVDGFVLVVPKKNVKAYVRMAKEAGKLWTKYGATMYVETVGDELKPNTHGMKCLTFPQMVKLKKGENVWFSFVVYKSKAHRNAVNAKVMKDPVMCDPKNKDMKMPFDMKRMAFGGFKAMVEY